MEPRTRGLNPAVRRRLGVRWWWFCPCLVGAKATCFAHKGGKAHFGVTRAGGALQLLSHVSVLVLVGSSFSARSE